MKFEWRFQIKVATRFDLLNAVASTQQANRVRRFILAIVRTWREITGNTSDTRMKENLSLASTCTYHKKQLRSEKERQKEKNQPKQTNKNNIFEEFGIWVMARRFEVCKSQSKSLNNFLFGAITNAKCIYLHSSPLVVFAIVIVIDIQFIFISSTYFSLFFFVAFRDS